MDTSEVLDFIDGLSHREAVQMLCYLSGYSPKGFAWAAGRIEHGRQGVRQDGTPTD